MFPPCLPFSPSLSVLYPPRRLFLCLSCTGQGGHFLTHCPCYPILRHCLLCLWLLLRWLLLAAQIRFGLPVHHIRPGMSTPWLHLKPPSPSLHLSPLTSQLHLDSSPPRLHLELLSSWLHWANLSLQLHPWSVVAVTLPRTSRPLAVTLPSTPFALLGSSFLPALPQSHRLSLSPLAPWLHLARSSLCLCLGLQVLLCRTVSLDLRLHLRLHLHQLHLCQSSPWIHLASPPRFHHGSFLHRLHCGPSSC